MWSVSSDIGELKAVLVNMPGPECGLNLSLDIGHPAAIDDIIDVDEAQNEHCDFIQLIRKHAPAANIYSLNNLLDQLHSLPLREKEIIREEFLSIEGTKAEELEIDAHTLLGANEDLFFGDSSTKTFSPQVRRGYCQSPRDRQSPIPCQVHK